MNKCKICSGNTTVIFSKKILNKHLTNYNHCNNCKFICTDTPHWLPEAYSTAITKLDIGLLNRNLRMLQVVPEIIDCCVPNASKLLDYAGGYGIFSRLMRDEGYNYFHHDSYCENIFAKYFECNDLSNIQFDFITAFEVLEHFEDPLHEVEKIFDLSQNVLFTTELIPIDFSQLENWWYLSLETGQHISFYSSESLKLIAEKHKLNYYNRNNQLHLFTKNKLSEQQVDFFVNSNRLNSKWFGLKKQSISFKKQRNSLLQQDYDFIKKTL